MPEPPGQPAEGRAGARRTALPVTREAGSVAEVASGPVVPLFGAAAAVVKGGLLMARAVRRRAVVCGGVPVLVPREFGSTRRNWPAAGRVKVRWTHIEIRWPVTR